jgi:hypothetical protein
LKFFKALVVFIFIFGHFVSERFLNSLLQINEQLLRQCAHLPPPSGHIFRGRATKGLKVNPAQYERLAAPPPPPDQPILINVKN